MSPEMKIGPQGSVSVEAAMLFPLCFLILILLMQTALFAVLKIRVEIVAERAVKVCLAARERGVPHEEAMGVADEYLGEQVRYLPGLDADWNWNSEEGFLTEAFSLSVSGSFHLLTEEAWQSTVKETYMDPAVFRNRVDMVLEIIKGWKDK